MALEHARLALRLQGDTRKTVIEFRKHLGWYTKGLHGASELRQRLFQVESIAEAEAIFLEYLEPVAAGGVRAEQLEALLADVAAGRLAPGAALERLRHLPFEDLAFARIDHHRALRQGQPEVVFCEGKTLEQVVAICERLEAATGSFLGTARQRGDGGRAAARGFRACAGIRLARTVHLRPPADRAAGHRAGRCWWSPPAPATSRWPRRRRSSPRPSGTGGAAGRRGRRRPAPAARRGRQLQRARRRHRGRGHGGRAAQRRGRAGARCR